MGRGEGRGGTLRYSRYIEVHYANIMYRYVPALSLSLSL